MFHSKIKLSMCDHIIRYEIHESLGVDYIYQYIVQSLHVWSIGQELRNSKFEIRDSISEIRDSKFNILINQWEER